MCYRNKYTIQNAFVAVLEYDNRLLLLTFSFKPQLSIADHAAQEKKIILVTMALSCLFHAGSVHPDTFRGHCGWTRKSDAEETLAHRSKMPSLHT